MKRSAQEAWVSCVTLTYRPALHWPQGCLSSCIALQNVRCGAACASTSRLRLGADHAAGPAKHYVKLVMRVAWSAVGVCGYECAHGYAAMSVHMDMRL